MKRDECSGSRQPSQVKDQPGHERMIVNDGWNFSVMHNFTSGS